VTETAGREPQTNPFESPSYPLNAAHQNFGASNDLVVISTYPQGQSYDRCQGGREEQPEADQRIVCVPRPESDPLYGPDGPLVEHWSAQAPVRSPDDFRKSACD